MMTEEILFLFFSGEIEALNMPIIEKIENGWKILIFYKHNNKIINYLKYLDLLDDYDNKIINTAPDFSNHITYMHAITSDMTAITNFTSQPYIKTLEGNVNNIKLENNAFRFVTPTIMVNNFILNAYIKDADNAKLPDNLNKYTNEELLQYAYTGIAESYKYCMRTQHVFYKLEMNVDLSLKTYAEALSTFETARSGCISDLRDIASYKKEINQVCTTTKFSEIRDSGFLELLEKSRKQEKYRC